VDRHRGRERRAEREKPLRFSTPLWDTLILRGALLALLAIEWTIRRLAGP